MNKGPTVLLVEDNRGDVILTAHALDEAGILYDLHVVGDGMDALDFFCRRGKYADAPEPTLIILDLNMPRKDGRELLKTIVQDPRLDSIPLVIFTSAEFGYHQIEGFDPQKHLFLTKPHSFRGYVDAVREMENFRTRIKH